MESKDVLEMRLTSLQERVEELRAEALGVQQELDALHRKEKLQAMLDTLSPEEKQALLQIANV